MDAQLKVERVEAELAQRTQHSIELQTTIRQLQAQLAEAHGASHVAKADAQLAHMATELATALARAEAADAAVQSLHVEQEALLDKCQALAQHATLTTQQLEAYQAGTDVVEVATARQYLPASRVMELRAYFQHKVERLRHDNGRLVTHVSELRHALDTQHHLWAAALPTTTTTTTVTTKGSTHPHASFSSSSTSTSSDTSRTSSSFANSSLSSHTSGPATSTAALPPPASWQVVAAQVDRIHRLETVVALYRQQLDAVTVQLDQAQVDQLLHHDPTLASAYTAAIERSAHWRQRTMFALWRQLFISAIAARIRKTSRAQQTVKRCFLAWRFVLFGLTHLCGVVDFSPSLMCILSCVCVCVCVCV
jgi:hypothetical protein